jgi:outer membrane protein assembly factor BamB
MAEYKSAPQLVIRNLTDYQQRIHKEQRIVIARISWEVTMSQNTGPDACWKHDNVLGCRPTATVSGRRPRHRIAADIGEASWMRHAISLSLICSFCVVAYPEERGPRLVEAARQGDAVKDLTAQRDDEAVAARESWPSFRGPRSRGIAAAQNLPDQWNVEEGQGVLWRTPIPGLANSSPIIWAERVFVTTAVSSEGNRSLRIGLYGDPKAAGDDCSHSWRLICLDKKTGRILWDGVAHEGVPPVKRHQKSTHANSTPATDGKHVVALFSSGGLYCYGVKGQLKWKQDLGVLDCGAYNAPKYQWGFGSSPIIYRDRVIVQCDLQGDSFLAAYDLETGKQLWSEPRDEPPSWGTPTVYESPRGPHILTTGSQYTRGNDALSGREIWRLSGHSLITVPTPFVAHDLIFVTSGYYRHIQPIYAIRTSAEGDISLAGDERTNEAVCWSEPKGGPYLPTPLVYGNHLYTCSNRGILTCYVAKSGKRIYRKRFAHSDAASFTASPVAADGRIFLTAEAGAVYVVKAGPEYELLSVNDLGGYCLSTPAIAGGLFLARTQKHLVAIGADE